MRYFEVEKEKLFGDTKRYPVNSDGTWGGDSYDVDSDDMATAVVVGFAVNVYDEQGMLQNVEFYPVKSDMGKPPINDDAGEWVFQSNEDEVLKQIREEHAPEDGWQNNMW